MKGQTWKNERVSQYCGHHFKLDRERAHVINASLLTTCNVIVRFAPSHFSHL